MVAPGRRAGVVDVHRDARRRQTGSLVHVDLHIGEPAPKSLVQKDSLGEQDVTYAEHRPAGYLIDEVGQVPDMAAVVA